LESLKGINMNLETLAKTSMEAIERGESLYFSGKTCKHGHVSARYALSGSCRQCTIEKAKKYNEIRLQKILAIRERLKDC